MKSGCLALLAVICATLASHAQQQPFDMSPEQSTTSPSAPATAATPATPAAPAAPAVPVAGEAPAPKTAGKAAWLRYLLPSSEFVLAGENATRAWSIYLTPEEAGASATLNLGYQNAVIVAPEASQLRLFINGRKLFDAPIASSDKVSEISVTPPAGLLRAGFNDIRIESVQRHRTDCTVESTYELWTEIKPERTFLSFAGEQPMAWQRIEDFRAIGVDASGQTVLNLVVPGIDQAASTGAVMRLAQGLGLMADMPNQSFVVSQAATPARGPGAATIVVGTAAELRGILSALPDDADNAPLATLVNDAKLGPATLVVTGPTWPAIEKAVDSIVAPLDRKLGVPRATIATSSWRSPNAPLLLAASRLPLSDLGIATQEFSGRRFRTDFAIGVPSDFFASAYGEASILLDAAYTADVLPGSHIDIYVNDSIAATVPINVAGGEILRHLPIKVTMRHFKPGYNKIGIEAVLLTDADRLCQPGATGLPGGRFVLFDTSEFVMPDYARIGQIPNLAALGGTGFPYSRAEVPVPLILDRSQIGSFSAAATLLARMAVAAGRLIPLDATAAPAEAAQGNGIFIGVVSQIPAEVLNQVGIAGTAATAWSETGSGANAAETGTETNATLDRWRDRVGGEGLRGRLTAFADWLKRTFNLSPDALRLTPGKDNDFLPRANLSLLVAQQESPAGHGTWTLITAPTQDALDDGVRNLTSEANWQQLAGHITTYDGSAGDFASLPVGRYAFLETQDFSLSNYRLILANWLSSNTLSYAGLLTLFCMMLGFATSRLLGKLGRSQ